MNYNLKFLEYLPNRILIHYVEHNSVFYYKDHHIKIDENKFGIPVYELISYYQNGEWDYISYATLKEAFDAIDRWGLNEHFNNSYRSRIFTLQYGIENGYEILIYNGNKIFWYKNDIDYMCFEVNGKVFFGLVSALIYIENWC